ncbi:hypothetical protein MLD38_009254 [Melastoma candidum]|uniref:Uncharacterized protein n=1 Tax=Melastoma candidum TaxID=119954 RepID=A0ACB9RWE0_9MYRT|nr:hypothetical protein MLD38_009254 [Melastoma candidum]
MVALMDLLFSPTSKVLNRWFETDVLKAAIAADATVGSMASINSVGSGYVLLHHVMGQTDGERNVWSHVEGGMGSVSLAISRAARELGVHILTNAEVLLADGTKVGGFSGSVECNTANASVMQYLVPRELLSDDFVRSIEFSDYTSGTTKINVAIDRLPHFSSYGSKKDEVGPHHTATIRIGCESMECIAAACQDACNGVPSRRPIMEMTIPSTLDETMSSPGKHVVGLFTQYTPYKPTDGSWEDPSYRELYAERCFSLIDEYAPGFQVIGHWIQHADSPRSRAGNRSYRR